MILIAILASILDLTNKTHPKVTLMYLVKLLIFENLYFATNFVKLSVLEQKLWTFIGFGGHLGCKIA